MTPIARSPKAKYPFLEDRELYNEVVDVMNYTIHKVLKWKYHGPPKVGVHPDRVASANPTLPGTGISAEDILSDALEGLLQYKSDRGVRSWQALAVTVARNKTIEALRTAQKGLRGTAHRPEFYLVSGDAVQQGPAGEAKAPLFEMLPAAWGDPEEEYFKLAGLRELISLARELLDERELKIVFDIHFFRKTRREIGEEIQLTGARVGQIFNAAMRRLEKGLSSNVSRSREPRKEAR